MNEAIRVENLRMNFGKLEVLKGIGLSIQKGTILALLGPNGSGKSTLVKCILGLVNPASGDIFVDGSRIRGSWEYRAKIGYMPQIARFPENMKVHELFSLMKDIRRQPSNEEEFISLLRIEDALNKPLKTLSGGTKQKVNAILALMFDSGILVFDEATAGLDPASRLKFKQQIRKEKEKGKTIILVSHFINEVEELSDELAFLLEGKVYFHGTVSQLKKEGKDENLEKVIADILEGRQGKEDRTNV